MLFEIYIAFVSVFILLLYVLRITFSSAKNTVELQSKDLTVIIPIRNEEKNIDKLLAAFSQQIDLPRSIIFVDDHSEDNGLDKVKDFCNEHQEAICLKLDNQNIGKKRAIHTAMQSVKTEFVLTLDADTWFGERFFSKISVQDSAQMMVRPVVLESNSFWQYFYSLEQLLLSSFNFLLFPVYPLTASGANLLFRKEAYINFNDLQTHESIASGDDHFFLRNLEDNKQKILVSNEYEDIVYTNAPRSFKAYIHQRVRWLGKTLIYPDLKNSLVGVFFMIYFVGGFTLMVYLVLQQKYFDLIILCSVRIFLDALVFLPYVIPLKKFRYIIFLPFHQFVQPVLLLFVLFSLLIIHPRWKGRDI